MGIFVTILILLGLYAWFFILSRQIWDVVDTPTVSPSGAIIGLCEVEGKSVPSRTPTGDELPTLTGPISGYPCVWFEVNVEYYDEDGKDSGWKNFCKKASDGGFRIADEYGSIAVSPEGAEKYFTKPINESGTKDVIMRAYDYFVQFPSGSDQLITSLWVTSPDGYYMWHPNLKQWIPSRYVSPDKKYYFDWEKLKWIEVAHSSKFSLGSMLSSLSTNRWTDSRLRVTETAVFPNQDIFAHGYVNVTPDGTDIKIGKKKNTVGGFFLSSQGESKLLKKLKLRKWLIFGISVALSLFLSNTYLRVPVETYVGTNEYGERTPLGYVVQIGMVVGLFAIGGLLLKFLRTYNRFVRLREQVRLSRSAINITTKRRATLVPELCDVLDELMKHEKAVLESVTRLRNENVDSFSKEIFAIAEAYPAIKSSQNFLHMQNELGRTEEKIAMARSFVNDSILAMDNLRATLVGMIFSPLFSKEQRPTE